MKKLLSLILAAASIFTMGTAVFAETEKTNSSTDATITFDTDKALDYVHTFGNASDTGLKTEISEKEVIWGRSLLMSEDFKGSLSNRYGGFYLDAADFGLANFGGYTVTFNIHATKEAAKATDRFEIFADGDQWSSTPFCHQQQRHMGNSFHDSSRRFQEHKGGHLHSHHRDLYRKCVLRG
ncbi:MAG: hypothetical protein L6V87_07620 [Ruminococcus sp.]|nr:MAG: hypothetical protein L6V87_07620 [Ruminococcus sp.]